MTDMTEHHAIRFFVNGTEVHTDERELTGAQIKALGNVPPEESLFRMQGNKKIPVADEDVVKLRNGMKFRSGPVGGVS